MRNFLDRILVYLSFGTITDQEATDLNLAAVPGPTYFTNLDAYNWLVSLLQSRSEPQASFTRLKDLYAAKGVEVEPKAPVPKTNIFIGAPL